MKYTVETIKANGETTYNTGLSKRDAVKLAIDLASKTNDRVYVTWMRSSDHQHGYLNPGGHHEITGKAW